MYNYMAILDAGKLPGHLFISFNIKIFIGTCEKRKVSNQTHVNPGIPEMAEANTGDCSLAFIEIIRLGCQCMYPICHDFMFYSLHR